MHSSDSMSNYNIEQESEKPEEEESYSKKNRTYKSKKILKNISNLTNNNEIQESNNKNEQPIRRIYIKKKRDNNESGEFNQINLNKKIKIEKNENEEDLTDNYSTNIYEKKIIRKEINNNSFDEKYTDADYIVKKKNKTVRHQTAVNNEKPLYTSKRYLPTKLKIFKCVIYKNLGPNVNETTIKNILHRNGSQIMENGGFVIKLNNPEGKMYKSHKNII
jgi:hypothetical protein